MKGDGGLMIGAGSDYRLIAQGTGICGLRFTNTELDPACINTFGGR